MEFQWITWYFKDGHLTQVPMTFMQVLARDSFYIFILQPL